MSHPSRDDLAVYALGGLDPSEEVAVSEHASGCEQCTAELGHLAPAVGVLAESVEQHEPPPELRARLMSIVREEAAAEAAPVPAGPKRRRRFDLGGIMLRPATGLAAVAIGAAAVGGYLVADDDNGGSETTVPVASTMQGAGGTLVVEGDEATLRVHDMPALDKGAVYQVWVAEGAAVRPSAAFVPHDDGSATAAVPEASEGAEMVLVTRESRPGVRTPTMPAVLTARLN
jgi:anti-sigma factor ChrR (cupin superfamily)